MMLVSWLLKPFRKREVIYPFRPLIQAMIEKDAELYAVIGPMVPSIGILLWKEKYPEDFPAYPQFSDVEIHS